MSRRLSSMTTLVVALIMTLTAQAANAQEAASEPPRTTVLLDRGFSNHLPAGQWAPLRVVVSPMEEAIEAIARIRVETPDGQSLTTIAPVTTTPGRETVVATTFWVPPSIASITVELVGRGGARIAYTAYGAVAGAQSITLSPPTAMPIILGVGSPSLRLAFGNDNYQRPFDTAQEEQVGDRAAVAKVASAFPHSPGGPIWLPTTPMAYQGLAAVVIDGQLAASLEPEGLRAMRQWLVSGGRVMITNADNNGLRLILGEHLPQGLAAGPATNRNLPALLGGPGEVLSRDVDTRSLPAGWEPLLTAQDLAVQGPVGLGWVMVLGFDPDDLADAGLAASTEMAWHGTLAVMLEDELETGRKSLGQQEWDDQPLGQTSAMNALEWVSRAPTVGMGAFAAIFAMMAALAVALGPVDRLLLKKLHALHRWWLAALAWITLASVGAWVLPARVRSGPTTVSSIRVVDAMRSPDGTTRAWQTTVDGLFMNRSATIGLDDLEPDAWLSPMVHPWQSLGSGSLVMSPAGSVMRPQPTSARLWTVRNFLQQGPTTPPIDARFEADDGRYTLRLLGPLADGVEVAAVRTSGQWLHVVPGGSPRRDAGGVAFAATRRDLTLRPPDQFEARVATDSYYGIHAYGYAYPNDEPEAPRPGLMLHLDGPAARSRALEALSDTDRWAVVYLSFSNDQPLIGSDVGEAFGTTWVCRLAVPVDIAGRSAPVEGSP